MVSFKGYSQRRHADYWKIPYTGEHLKNDQLRSIIDSAGGERHYPVATVSTRLFQLARRTQRRLRCYDGDSVAQLKEFVQQRGLAAATQVKKSELVEMLEAADEDATFARFLDLPPELRTLIYEFHFASYSTNVRLGAIQSALPPPITHANSQIRKESLKLFYATCHFGFDFIQSNDPQPHVTARATNILRYLPQELFAAARNFRVNVRTSSYYHIECFIHLTGNAKVSLGLRDLSGEVQKITSTISEAEEVRRYFAQDFLRSWPPTLTVEIVDTLSSIKARFDPDMGSDEDDW